MGDNNLCPEIPEREKHFTDLPILAHVYLAVQVLQMSKEINFMTDDRVLVFEIW